MVPDAIGTLPASLPPNTYGAYLDTAWNPQFNNWFGAELEVSPGVYSDFTLFNTNSLRVLGRGLAVFTFTPTLQFKFGNLVHRSVGYQTLAGRRHRVDAKSRRAL